MEENMTDSSSSTSCDSSSGPYFLTLWSLITTTLLARVYFHGKDDIRKLSRNDNIATCCVLIGFLIGQFGINANVMLNEPIMCGNGHTRGIGFSAVIMGGLVCTLTMWLMGTIIANITSIFYVVCCTILWTTPIIGMEFAMIEYFVRHGGRDWDWGFAIPIIVTPCAAFIFGLLLLKSPRGIMVDGVLVAPPQTKLWEEITFILALGWWWGPLMALISGLIGKMIAGTSIHDLNNSLKATTWYMLGLSIIHIASVICLDNSHTSAPHPALEMNHPDANEQIGQIEQIEQTQQIEQIQA